jgi:nucleotide-binding universal stress UspA family protein
MAGYELPEPSEGNPAAHPAESPSQQQPRPPRSKPKPSKPHPTSASASPTGSPPSMPGFELQSQNVRACDPAFLHGVVVGFDGSVSSERALAYAVGMARRSRTGLVIVHVANRLPATVWAGCEPPVFVDVPDHRTEVLGLELACSDFLGDVPWVLVERGGDICHELEEVAREYAADAIVVGGTNGFLARLFGSVAGRLARRANRPVVVIP